MEGFYKKDNIAVKSTMLSFSTKLSVCMVWISMSNVIAHSNSAFK